MKQIISLVIVLTLFLSLFSCFAKEKEISYSFINGANLEEFSIVYSEDDHDYSKRAAEYIHNEIKRRTNLDLPIMKDSESDDEHEIIVGNTNRELSLDLEEELENFEFSILADENNVALEGNYFVIAAAAYYFIENYVPNDDYNAVIPTEARVLTPVAKEAKNYILLIGDGMGVNHTLLFDHLDDVSGYSDGEKEFYGYMFPSMGYSRTDSLDGTTDSAAGGTALSTGYKTTNGTVGRDKDGKDLLLFTEFCGQRGMSTAVMSTEKKTGATPSTFSAHVDNRDSAALIRASQLVTVAQYGTIINCSYDYYTKDKIISDVEGNISNTLNTLNADEDGFFLMYEEAYIDKHSHNNEMDKTFLALIRFNQAIGRFMEFAFYNPDTFVLITADHETGGITTGEDGKFTYTTDGHTSANVPIFAWGVGSELFNGKTVENIQIPMTMASLMGVTNFGDQSQFTYLK